MNLAVANKLNCMCDELITVISLLDRIQGRAGRRLSTDNHRAQEKALRKKTLPSHKYSISKEALESAPFKLIA